MSNTLTEKAVVDRLKTLFEEIATLQEDVKQLVKDAKEQGLPAPRLKKLAKLEVDGKLEEYREEFEAMQAAARAVGIDELELEPVLPLESAHQIKPPQTNTAGDRRADEQASVDEAIKRFSYVPPPHQPPEPFDAATPEFDRDAALTIPPALRSTP